jgi:hypothetical protein
MLNNSVISTFTRARAIFGLAGGARAARKRRYHAEVTFRVTVRVKYGKAEMRPRQRIIRRCGDTRSLATRFACV